MRKILVDTDALVALAKRDDFNHHHALEIAKRLKKRYSLPFSPDHS